MATIEWGILEGSIRLTENGFEGCTVTALVSDLAASGELRLLEGAAAIRSARAIGSALDAAYPNVKLVDIQSIRVVKTSAVLYHLNYRERIPEEGTSGRIQIGVSLAAVQSTADADGNEISLSYTYPEDYPDADLAGQTVEQGGLIGANLPTHTIVLTRSEASDPAAKSRAYSGKFNSDGWGLHEAADPHTWRCDGITGQSSGGEWEVTYSFSYNPETWKVWATFIDRRTGMPPPDLVLNTGKKLVLPPPGEADFAVLFPIPEEE